MAGKAYRADQIFFGLLALGFGIASIVYATVPGTIAAQFAEWDVRLGGSAGGYPEPQCRIWISLAAANVATLSLMSALLARDMVRWGALRIPLLFMKSVSALLFLAWWIAVPGARSLLGAALGDFATAGAIWYFAERGLATAAADGRTGVAALAR